LPHCAGLEVRAGASGDVHFRRRDPDGRPGRGRVPVARCYIEVSQVAP
jgi:hypothetical protein